MNYKRNMRAILERPYVGLLNSLNPDPELDYFEYPDNAAAQAAYVSNGLLDIYGPDILTGGTASADSETNGATANGCDNNEATEWQTNDTDLPHWWKYDLGAGVTKTIRKFRSKIYYALGKDFTIAGSNNDSDWTTLYSGTRAENSDWQEFTFENSTAYRYYKYTVTTNYTAYKYGHTYEFEMMEIVDSLQCYSESTIKTQGSYSLKGIAAITGSLNKTLTRTVDPPINCSGMNSWKTDVRALRLGSNFKITLRDAGGTLTEVTPDIAEASVFQTEDVDISAVADADKDAINQIKITILNADAPNTIYFDNMFAEFIPTEAAYRAQKGLISGFHCFVKQYIDFTKAGLAPLKLPDGTLW